MSNQWIDQERLWALADQDNCNGECDIEPSCERCPECLARSAINEIGEIMRDRLDEIDKSSILPVKAAKDSEKHKD